MRWKRFWIRKSKILLNRQGHKENQRLCALGGLIVFMPQPPHIAIIVLAAGASTRLGAPKQLLLYKGTTLLRRTVETALLVKVKSVHVVLGFESEKMKLEIADLPVHIIVNSNWQHGVSTSLRSGIQSLEPDIEAALIVLCDQLKLSTDILNTLISTYTSTRAPIVTCKYAGTVGVPTLYDRRIFPELVSLEGDHGAKKIIERHTKERVEIDFSGGEIDIDTVDSQIQLS
jgi:molybdenum cofactor cytidylyltransferase